MSLFSTLIKTGLAKKVIDQARKPQNQQKAKDLFQKVVDKRKGGTAGPR